MNRLIFSLAMMAVFQQTTIAQNATTGPGRFTGGSSGAHGGSSSSGSPLSGFSEEINNNGASTNAPGPSGSGQSGGAAQSGGGGQQVGGGPQSTTVTPSDPFEGLGEHEPNQSAAIEQFSVARVGAGHSVLAEGVYLLKPNTRIWFCPILLGSTAMMLAAFPDPLYLAYTITGMASGSGPGSTASNEFTLSTDTNDGVITGTKIMSDLSPSYSVPTIGPEIAIPLNFEWLAIKIRAEARGDGTIAGAGCVRGRII